MAISNSLRNHFYQARLAFLQCTSCHFQGDLISSLMSADRGRSTEAMRNPPCWCTCANAGHVISDKNVFNTTTLIMRWFLLLTGAALRTSSLVSHCQLGFMWYFPLLQGSSYGTSPLLYVASAFLWSQNYTFIFVQTDNKMHGQEKWANVAHNERISSHFNCNSTYPFIRLPVDNQAKRDDCP